MRDKATDRTAKIVALLQEKVRLEPWHRRLFYIVFGVLWGSGSLWLFIEWFKDPELGTARTLLQTISMKVHGATMLVYLALLGTLIAHIRRGTALKANRLSGFTMIALNGVLVLSGWLLYYVSDDAVREFSSTIHWVIGLIALPLLCTHILAGRGWTAKLLDLSSPRTAPAAGLQGFETESSAVIAPDSPRVCLRSGVQVSPPGTLPSGPLPSKR